MGRTKRMRRRKEYLYSLNPYCPLCGVKMVLNPRGKYSNKAELATIDHIYNRYHPEKRLRKQTIKEKIRNFRTRIGRTRLVCNKCNSGIADKETLALSKKELWRRSGRKPSGIIGKIKGIIREFKGG